MPQPTSCQVIERRHCVQRTSGERPVRAMNAFTTRPVGQRDAARPSELRKIEGGLQLATFDAPREASREFRSMNDYLLANGQSRHDRQKILDGSFAGPHRPNKRRLKRRRRPIRCTTRPPLPLPRVSQCLVTALSFGRGHRFRRTRGPSAMGQLVPFDQLLSEAISPIRVLVGFD